MINNIISAIALAISLEFGAEEYEIYKEDIKQDLKEPCFYIQSLGFTKERFLGKRFFQTNLFMIQYFPKSLQTQSEINSVTQRLFDALEMIDFKGDLIRGTEMNAETVDNILNFSVNYDLFTIKADEDDNKMDSFDFSIATKE